MENMRASSGERYRKYKVKPERLQFFGAVWYKDILKQEVVWSV